MPKDLVNSSCFIEKSFIDKDGGPPKILTVCIDLSNINSVQDLLRVSLFEINHSETSHRVIPFIAKFKCVTSS